MDKFSESRATGAIKAEAPGSERPNGRGGRERDRGAASFTAHLRGTNTVARLKGEGEALMKRTHFASAEQEGALATPPLQKGKKLSSKASWQGDLNLTLENKLYVQCARLQRLMMP